MRHIYKRTNEHLGEKQLYQISENTMNHFPKYDESEMQTELTKVVRVSLSLREEKKQIEFHVELFDSSTSIRQSSSCRNSRDEISIKII